jgi:hypothetical protein
MKKTFNVDADLLKRARKACSADTDTDTLRLGLQALIRDHAFERVRALRGSEKTLNETPRRREAPTKKSRAA